MGQQSLQCWQPPSQPEMFYQARPQYRIWMSFLIYCNSDGWNPSPLYRSGSEEMSWPRKNPGYGAALSGMVLQRTLVGTFWHFKLTLFYCKHYLSIFEKTFLWFSSALTCCVHSGNQDLGIVGGRAKLVCSLCSAGMSVELFSICIGIWKTCNCASYQLSQIPHCFCSVLARLHFMLCRMCCLAGFLLVSPYNFVVFVPQDVVPVIVDYCLLLQRM